MHEIEMRSPDRFSHAGRLRVRKTSLMLPLRRTGYSSDLPTHTTTTTTTTTVPYSMNTFAYLCLTCMITCVLNGCASISMLPKSAADVDFDAGVEGKTGWAQYQETARFESVGKDQVFNACKAGLAAANFSLVSANRDLGVVMGEHGMTMHDWNVIAGIYFRERSAGYDVKVIVEGSKDIGFSGDATGSGWTGRILNGMRTMLSQSGAGTVTKTPDSTGPAAEGDPKAATPPASAPQ